MNPYFVVKYVFFEGFKLPILPVKKRESYLYLCTVLIIHTQKKGTYKFISKSIPVCLEFGLVFSWSDLLVLEISITTLVMKLDTVDTSDEQHGHM